MRKVLAGLRRAGDERGQGLVEYALIIAIVSLGALVSLGFLSGKINGLFSKAGNSVESVQVADGAGGGGGPSGPTPPSGGTITLQQLGGQGSNPSFLMTASAGGWTGAGSGNAYTYSWEQGNISGTGAPTNCSGLTWSAFGSSQAGGTSVTRAPEDPSGNANSGDRCYRVTVTVTGPGGTSAPLTSSALFVNNV
jgi:Flp pilus assembly pilin Flp